MIEETLKKSPLGKDTPYLTTYMPSLLFAIPRDAARKQTGLVDPVPFDGVDIWNAYELSWLTPSGKPQVAIGEFHLPCLSPNLIESKSLKIYLHSFNQTVFESAEVVKQTLQRDISACCGSPVKVHLLTPHQFHQLGMARFEGECLDDLDISTNIYQVDSSLLKNASDKVVEESLYSDLLKANCLVTSQPDWGHIWLHYKGPQIDRKALLKYIISYRNHNGFHEQCVERIFSDIMNICRPSKLSVYGRFTRRGGLDINSFRSNWEKTPRHNLRLYRQ